VTEPAPGFRQTLTWKGGFWLALVIPMSGLTLVGYEIGALGAWGALAVWLGTSVIGVGLVSYFFTRRVQLGLRGRRLWQDDPESPARPSEPVTAASAS
jgi:hypothetical protein